MTNSDDPKDLIPADASGATPPAVTPPSGERRITRLPQRFLPARFRQQWREEFPYHWSADDLVTRRDTLRFLAVGSGALFVASAVMAVAGNLVPAGSQRALPIANVSDVPVNSSVVFSYPDQYAQGILINLPGRGLVAYSDVCTHLSCAVLYEPDQQRLHCPCHEGLFDASTGNVLAGPPTRPLPAINIELRGDTVWAVGEMAR